MLIQSKQILKCNVSWKFMIAGYDENRRGHMTATIKQLEACVEDEDCTNHNGDEMKLSVSDGKFNLRAIIKDNFPSVDKIR